MTAAATGLTGADPLYWPCGYCGAAAGAPCATLSGRRVGARVHGDRAQSVRLWRPDRADRDVPQPVRNTIRGYCS